MFRTFAYVFVSMVGLHLAAGCSGDDGVNPTNPDASTAKPSDASSDGHASLAAKDGSGTYK